MANDEQNPVVPPVLTVVPAIPAVTPVVEAVAAPVAATPAPAVVAPVTQEVLTQAVQPAQAAVQQVAAPVLSFGEKLTSGVSYLWANDKVFLLIFGVLIFVAYASSTLMDLITSKSNKDVADAKATDAKLATKENDAKAQAASYQQQAAQAAADEPQVDEDWNVKK